MLATYFFLSWVIILPPALAEAGPGPAERVAVPLCRALERLGPGDQIPVIVSGIYAVDHFYDPEESTCRLDVDPSVCVEFSSGLERPPEFDVLHHESLRVFATFSGVLHGRPPDPRMNDPTLPTTARLAYANSSRFCANLYRAKLAVESILDFSEVPKKVPWQTDASKADANQRFPLMMSLPAYPKSAVNLQLEGSVLVRLDHVAIDRETGARNFNLLIGTVPLFWIGCMNSVQPSTLEGAEQRQPVIVSEACRVGDFTIMASDHILVEIQENFIVRKVRGRIISESGEWPPGGVLFELKGLNQEEIESTYSDTDGFFSMPKVKKGTYCFKASIEGWQSVMGIVVVDERDAKAAAIDFEMLLGV
jgi:hypothetical protein